MSRFVAWLCQNIAVLVIVLATLDSCMFRFVQASNLIHIWNCCQELSTPPWQKLRHHFLQLSFWSSSLLISYNSWNLVWGTGYCYHWIWFLVCFEGVDISPLFTCSTGTCSTGTMCWPLVISCRDGSGNTVYRAYTFDSFSLPLYMPLYCPPSVCDYGVSIARYTPLGYQYASLKIALLKL